MKTHTMMLLLATSGWLGAERAAAAGEGAYRVIVHPNNPVDSMTKSQVRDLFLKKTKTWEHGMSVLPVDQLVDKETRRIFSDEVLGRGVGSVQSYWQQRIFSGRDSPPPELSSDKLVAAYVLANPGAIGYVAADIQVGGAKVLTLR